MSDLALSDLALIVVFFSMILFPCWVAMRSLRTPATRSSGRASRVHFIHAVDDTGPAEEYAYSRLGPRHDRRALALQRSRDLYYRERERRSGRYATPGVPEFEQAGPVLVDKRAG